MIDFLRSVALAFGVVALTLAIGIPIGFWYLTHVVFPLLNIPYEHPSALDETDASGLSDNSGT